MPERARPMGREYGRTSDFMEHYRRESERMYRKPSSQNPASGNDAAVILPIMLLLMQEGADRYLLLALLYILM